MHIMIWSELENFSSASVCLVLTSDYYNEDDYIRDYEDFTKAVRESSKVNNK